MRSRKPKPRLTLKKAAAVRTDGLVTAVQALRVATAEQIGAWIGKHQDPLPKATLYRLLARAIDAGQLSFLEMDGHRLYHIDPHVALVFRDTGQMKPAPLPAGLQRQLARFASKHGIEEASLFVIIRPRESQSAHEEKPVVRRIM